jgi:hypothetical protein
MKNKWVKFLLVFCLIFAIDFVLYELQPPDAFHRIFPELLPPKRSFFSNPDAVIAGVVTALMGVIWLVLFGCIEKTNVLRSPSGAKIRGKTVLGWIDRVVFTIILLIDLLAFLVRKNYPLKIMGQLFAVTIPLGFIIVVLWFAAVIIRRFWKRLASLPYIPTDFGGGVWRLLFLFVSSFCLILNIFYPILSILPYF